MLVEYSYKKFKIVISEYKLRSLMSNSFPDLFKDLKALKNERYFYKEGKSISIGEKETIIQLLAEGKTQRYIASLVNTSQA